MPVDYRAPNINARRLGLHLRQIREALELSYDDAAERLGCEATWLIRLETGFEPATPEQVRRLLDRYPVPQHEIRGVLIDLASRPAGPPWLAGHVGRMKALVRDLITLESESPLIHTFGIMQMPELVRTEAYARLCFDWCIPEVDIDLEWELLASRQRHRPGGQDRTLDVILDESALRASGPHPHVVREQFEHLIGLAGDGRSTVRVIPRSAGAHAGLHGAFDVLEFPDINDRISLVHTALGIDLAQADLTGTWALIEEVALPIDESLDLIAAARDGLPAGSENESGTG